MTNLENNSSGETKKPFLSTDQSSQRDEIDLKVKKITRRNARLFGEGFGGYSNKAKNPPTVQTKSQQWLGVMRTG